MPVQISAPDGCGRFSGRVIRGVEREAPTPDWMSERLERAASAAISALVDISNYVMLELGRPLHVFDLDKIHGGIDVRWGRKGEKLKLLNGRTVELDETVGCASPTTQASIAGRHHGRRSTRRDDDTTQRLSRGGVLLARRDRRAARAATTSRPMPRTASSAASTPTNNVDDIERTTRLILEICGGEPGPTVDDHGASCRKRKPVTHARRARAQKVIGMPVPTRRWPTSSRAWACAFKREGRAPSPSRRRRTASTSQIEEDLIEEVARVYGFEHIAAHAAAAPSASMRRSRRAARSPARAARSAWPRSTTRR